LILGLELEMAAFAIHILIRIPKKRVSTSIQIPIDQHPTNRLTQNCLFGQVPFLDIPDSSPVCPAI
jgi:hypothetical protein